MARVRGRTQKDSGAHTGGRLSEGGVLAIREGRPALSLPGLLPLAYEWMLPFIRSIFGDFLHRRKTEAGGRGWSSAPAPQHREICGWNEHPLGTGSLGARVDMLAGWSHSHPMDSWWTADKERQLSESQQTTDKTDKHLPVAGRWWEEAQSWGCPHPGWKH